MKRNKKGFTIVELVIVIAVIAILSAILIPTFVNLTTKAENARAKQEVADAYAAYVIDAGDGFVGEDKTTNSYAITIMAQDKVVIARGTDNYTYSQEDGWKVDSTVGLLDSYSLIQKSKEDSNPQLYNNCSVYLHK